MKLALNVSKYHQKLFRSMLSMHLMQDENEKNYMSTFVVHIIKVDSRDVTWEYYTLMFVTNFKKIFLGIIYSHEEG